MNANWVAASVRAKSLAQRRVGAGRCHRLATQQGLSQALLLLADTAHAERLSGVTDLATAQQATRETLLWQLRVLAGWLPPGGTAVIRAAAGAYERDNITALARHLEAGSAMTHEYDLGALATAWPRLRVQASIPALTEALRRSAWGELGPLDTVALRDVLTLVWLRRVAAVAPAASGWARSAAALLSARMLLVDDTTPSARVLELVHPWLGSAWPRARDVAEFRSALPRPAQRLLEGIEGPADLWRAEARLLVEMETEASRLLRGSLPSPDVVLGAIAALAIDGWRLRAALAAAEVGTGSSEVLDAVA